MLRHRRLVWDLILVILDHVVGPAPVREEERNVSHAFWNPARKICEVSPSRADLLLRKQFWITLMMNEAASFSLKPGLNRCLNVGNETVSND